MVTARPSRGGTSLPLATRNPLGQRLVFQIVGTTKDERDHLWLQLLTPERPNGSTGWTRRAGLQIVHLHHRVEIDLSKFELRHFRDDKLIDRFNVGIGQDQFPTPKGSARSTSGPGSPSPVRPDPTGSTRWGSAASPPC